MSKEDKYYICKKIDEQKRYFGLPLDEFVPIALVLLIGFLVGRFITGFVIAGGIFLAIRHFKKGQGSSWLLNMAYWYLPLHLLQGALFKKTPPSFLRNWLA